MASHKYQALRGTFDVLPDVARARGRIERTAGAIFARAGCESIATPSFEGAEHFDEVAGELRRGGEQRPVHTGNLLAAITGGEA